MSYHPELKGCVLHGGAVDDNGNERFGDTWLFRDNRWSRMPELFDTPERDDHGLGYHASAGVMVMLEGLTKPRDVFGLGKAGWHKIDVDPMLPRLQCSQLTYAPPLAGLVMHGGETQHGGDQFDQTFVLRLAGNTK
jgi:hypothetical protein